MQLIKASLQDKSILKRICIDSYSTYFGDYWNDNGLEWYLQKNFSDLQLQSDLTNKEIDYFLINQDNTHIGFIKMNHQPMTDLPFHNCSELEKMYVLPDYKGLGAGQKALKRAMSFAQDRGKKILFLEVLANNNRAISFYTRLGFRIHSATRLQIPYFKDDLRALQIMYIKFNTNH